MQKIIWSAFAICLVGTIAGSVLAQDASAKGEDKSKDTEVNDGSRQRGRAVEKCVQRCDANGENCWTDCSH